MRFSFQKINHFMNLAYQEAKEAAYQDEVPVGAIVVSKEGVVLGQGFNEKEKNNSAMDHAELIAIKKATELIRGWRLNDASLFVTLEPCPMCLSAISQSRIAEVYFGAYDRKGGALSLGYNFHNDERLNHKMNVYGGFMAYECSRLLSSFFKKKRKNYS